ncbi:MAG: hypothetical protein VW378_06050 [bacterium]
MMFCIRAYGKINLNLSVSSLCPSGMHQVSSIFQTLSIYDDLYVEEVPEKRLFLQSNYRDYPVDEDNVLCRLYEKLKDRLPCGFHINVYKQIPIGAGLGGGSSQVAAFLRFLNDQYSLGYDALSLADLAHLFGSDVAYFLQGDHCLVEGFGERVTPVSCFDRDVFYLLILPSFSLSTKAIYAYFDSLQLGADFSSALLLPLGYNSLFAAVFDYSSEFRDLCALLNSLSLPDFYLSGSGSTLYIPFQDLDSAITSYQCLLDYSSKFDLFWTSPVSKPSIVF